MRYFTDIQNYTDIANAIRAQTGYSSSIYPSEMASMIHSNIKTLDYYYNVPTFSCLQDALDFYNGEYGNAMFFSQGGFDFKGSLSIYGSTSSAYYIYYNNFSVSNGVIAYQNVNGAYVNNVYSSYLTSVNWNAKYTAFGNATFISSQAYTYNASAKITQDISCDACSYIGSYAFQSANQLLRVYFKNCTRIYDDAFCSCLYLQKAIFPTCISVNSGAFYGCSWLNTISLPACKTINPYAFCCCYSLHSISLPACETINYGAFFSCSYLQTVFLPVCKSIGESAFYNNSPYYHQLSQIFLLSSSLVYTPSKYISILFQHSSNFTIYVPNSLLTTYQTDSTYGWSYYSSYFSAYNG